MLCRKEMPFSLDPWVILLVLSEAIRVWALAGVVGFFLGSPQPAPPPHLLQKKKRKGKRKPRKINLRQLGSSLNPGYRGAELFGGCPMGLCKELQNQQDPGVSPVLEPWGHKLFSPSESSPVKGEQEVFLGVVLRMK